MDIRVVVRQINAIHSLRLQIYIVLHRGILCLRSGDAAFMLIHVLMLQIYIHFRRIRIELTPEFRYIGTFAQL